ncbi:hypothetical protein [Yersinia similis]|uniref:Uncharacterized protein n=1 Tax=Yersinia similis TaxID=367190 RepID=A0A0T9QWX3_9GAMM|nr:hypothetical protein [Yersinia similis]AHK21037.1 hypothetical protein BF17_18455 [Yersinia similis]CFQ61552.1 Uncharacterised protein [Yersinia similis]CNB46699.1 Uncharacterised protein [Yersinia similis]CNF65503.1 Uncharacterised protein [Yersinia similis]CNG13748.1 Uncharacterised protein [Yersinia similis]
MTAVSQLISALAQSIPLLDVEPLQADKLERLDQGSVLDWLYTHLSQQQLMVYEEWKEYCGYMPELKSLDCISLPGNIGDFVMSLANEIDWDSIDPMTAEVDYFMLPYLLPYLEHINSYLQQYKLRLVDLAPFENAYIFCIHNTPQSINQLKDALKAFDIELCERDALDQQQATEYIQSLLQPNSDK